MPELDINSELVGQRVCHAARPEWGAGTVLRVQSTLVDGRFQHRVSVQFAIGHRQLLVPPARLIAPQAQPERAAGWLDQLGKQTPGDRLAALPESVTTFLGTPVQRLANLAPLYEHSEEPGSLVEWARRQAQVADPLSLWSRDELLAAFRLFCGRRDSVLRAAATLLRQKEGPGALAAALAAMSDPVSAAMRAALGTGRGRARGGPEP